MLRLGNIPLLFQPPRSQEPITGEAFHEWTQPENVVWALFYRRDADYLIRFPSLGDFEICSDGSAVTCWPVEGVSDATIQHLFLNQVQPLALSRSGQLVLHGSAVSLGDSCVVFLGPSGRGKSTLAASFATAGHPFLTDDGLLLERDGSEWLAMPSHPSIRLWEDSERAVLKSGATPQPPVQYTQKARFLAQSTIPFCAERKKVEGFYFIGDRKQETITIERLNPGQAMIEFLTNSFVLDTQDRDELARHFEDLAVLVGHPRLWRLDYPRSYAALDDVRAVIAAHELDAAR